MHDVLISFWTLHNPTQESTTDLQTAHHIYLGCLGFFLKISVNFQKMLMPDRLNVFGNKVIVVCNAGDDAVR